MVTKTVTTTKSWFKTITVIEHSDDKLSKQEVVDTILVLEKMFEPQLAVRKQTLDKVEEKIVELLKNI